MAPLSSVDDFVDLVKRNTLASVLCALVGFPLACFVLPIAAPLALVYYVLVQQNMVPSPLALQRQSAAKAAETKVEEEGKKAGSDTTPASGVKTESEGKAKAGASVVGKVAQRPQVESSVEGGRPLTGGVALLRRMREQKAAQAKRDNPDKKILVAYASQTGTAHEIAKVVHAQIAESCGSAKIPVLAAFNDVDIDTLRADKFPLVAFVAASTGDGDPPDNTASFYAKMLRKSDDEFKGVKYTCLGLGDSNYTRFMAVPRNMRKKFQSLGAENIYWDAEADEVDGLEETVDKWTEGAVKAVLKEYNALTNRSGGNVEAKGGKDSGFLGLPALLPRRVQFTWLSAKEGEGVKKGLRFSRDHVDGRGSYGPLAPYFAKVKSVKRVTPADYEKQIIHMELCLEGSNISYKPGDAFGVLPENSADLVGKILSYLGEDGSKCFTTSEQLNSIQTPCSIKDALSLHCDLTSPPKKTLLRMLAESCGEEKEKASLLEMISTAGKERYRKEILEGQPNLLDIFQAYPSCKPHAEDLIEFLPALAPREYSVSSASQVHTGEMHFAFSVVEYETVKGRVRHGVATTWLSKLAEEVEQGKTVRIPIFMRPSKEFQHPESISKPIIMIGPGTGVSPFRGFSHYRSFLQSRSKQDVGESWLFYGCRDRTKDFLYEEDFTELHEKSLLNHYEIAFSREQAEKVYVQHKMQDHQEKLGKLILEKEAYVFVCGDGLHMAKDVHKKLEDILCTSDAAMTPSSAKSYLQDMQKGGRYVRDIWS
ncbi:NADP/FAD dependent oxidoreductase [Chloropicon primus]|uniref:Methionine synthase reductase n=1 Tax=Chloropicon primus TaxID=1764295 RepID=A0A5B8MVP3_9CHLO|nr:NADP/FAD dependent oxidoreductase [Chloropicon primus]|eukprot:QDZ24421.1 NADP/FAD dependent oxidoreductase [Chloropicon primus]